MTLVAIVTSGCITKNFKCWQLGSIAWNTGRRAGKRQVWQKGTSNQGHECFLLCQAWIGNSGGNQWHGYIKCLLSSSQIIETEGGKKLFSIFLIPISRKKKKGHVSIWNWFLMISFCILDKLEVHMCLAGELHLASLDMVLFFRTWLFWVPDHLHLVLLCWFWSLMH